MNAVNDAAERKTCRKRWFDSVISLLSLPVTALGITVLSLVIAYGEYPASVFEGYFENPMILQLNYLPVLGGVILLWGITGRVALSNLVIAVLVIGGAIANYFKIAFRDDPVVFQDLALIKTGFDAVQSYDMELTIQIKLVLWCALCGWGILFLFFRKRKGNVPSRIAAILLVALCAVPLGQNYYLKEDIYLYGTVNPYLNRVWVPTEQYVTKGFVYPFLYSITDVLQIPPEGYDEQAAAEALAQYPDADIPEDKKVNLLVFQLEAFTDLEDMGVSGINRSVYSSYRTICKEAYSGTLLTNIFGGGTVNSEWSFLSGYPTLPTFRHNTNSYVWYLKQQGYSTGGSHPGFDWYYNRININQWLGFDNYLYVENHYDQFNPGNVSYDDVALPEMLRLYQEAAEGDAPVFQFNVTYQGHGPYDTEDTPHGDWFWNPGKDYPDVSDYTKCVLNNYLWSVKDTGDRMLQLLNTLRYDSEPVVVLLYGDHKPWLGDSNSCYHELGINIDCSTEEGIRNYYGTEYVIWANRAAQKVLGHKITGEGPDTGVCFLMNVLFEQLGWTGDSYMQAVEQTRSMLQAVSSEDYYVEDNTLVIGDSLSEEGKDALSDLMALQFYRRSEFIYGEK